MTATTTRTFAHPCPSCSKLLDAATPQGGGDARPGPGDLTLCLYCGAVLRYSVEMRPLLLSAEQIMVLRPEIREELARGQAAIIELNMRRKLRERRDH